jgi:D-amino-acid dehydrogenase
MLPRVGQGKRAGVFYNTGHGHLGWTLSAATAESIAETILHGTTGRATRNAGVAMPASQGS